MHPAGFPWDRLLLAAFPPKAIGRGKRVIAGRRIESAFTNDVQRVSHQELRLGIVGAQADHLLRKQVELFFKWIKQHLRIKSFFGTSENAVKTQLWNAVSVYVLVAIVKKRLNVSTELYTILQILSLTLFEKIPLIHLLTKTEYIPNNQHSLNQLNLFE